MSAHPHAHVIQLGQFDTAAFVADAAARAGAAPPRHPEAAGSPCQCSAPEPCWNHDPGRPGVLPGAGTLPTAPMAAVTARPRPTPYPRPVSPETAEAGAALAEVAGDEGWAPTRCQCSAPEPCRAHPAERPMLVRPPAWNDPHPDSPVGRTHRRLEHDRAAGVLPGSEPGQGAGVLPFLTDHELGAWTQALLAEHHRRQSRFADYRRGVQQAQRALDRKEGTAS